MRVKRSVGVIGVCFFSFYSGLILVILPLCPVCVEPGAGGFASSTGGLLALPWKCLWPFWSLCFSFMFCLWCGFSLSFVPSLWLWHETANPPIQPRGPDPISNRTVQWGDLWLWSAHQGGRGLRAGVEIRWGLLCTVPAEGEAWSAPHQWDMATFG